MWSFCSKSQYVKQNKLKTQGWGSSILVDPRGTKAWKLQPPSVLSLLPLPREDNINTLHEQQSGEHAGRMPDVKHTETPTRLQLQISDFETSCPRRNGVRTWNWTVAQCSFSVLPQTSFSRLLTGTSTTLFTSGHRENTTNETQETGPHTGVTHTSGVNMRAKSAASLGMGSG